ncbi:MAG: M23 family metallopeptidase [Acidimicrobiia bacterium]
MELYTEETARRRRRSRHVMVFAAALSAVSLSIAAVPGLSAFAGVTEPPPEPTTTTEPDPVPTTTTEPAPDPTTTTEPAPDPTTTTGVAPDTTTTSTPSEGSGPEAQAGTLDPGEALVPRPEFGYLSGHQRALVQDLQTATDVYAVRRFALVDLARQVTMAKGALDEASAAENAAVMREVFGPSDTARSRRLEADRKNARRARVLAQAALAAATARFTAQTQAVADALDERTSAESAIERELGSGAVRARPDAITATLAAAQAGQGDVIGVESIGQPIPGASLNSPFGLRNDPLSGGAGFHPGFDLAATSGTPIHAAAAGVVVLAGDCGGYGNCVVIDHGDSLATVYAHQSGLSARVGEHVDAGEVIGYVGSTGMSTGPHLHFEVRVHGLPVDPVLALPAD